MNKNVFYEVNGFAGIDDIASGDYMLLMHKNYERIPTGSYWNQKKHILLPNPWKHGKSF